LSLCDVFYCGWSLWVRCDGGSCFGVLMATVVAVVVVVAVAVVFGLSVADVV